MTRKKEQKETVEEKNIKLNDILEKQFIINTQAGSLLPLGITKSTSAISTMLINDPANEQKSIPREILLPTEKAQVKLSYMLNKDENLESRYNFTAFDREVHDAVASIYSSGIKTFTTAMVMAVLMGKESYTGVRARQEQTERIEKSLDKCIANRISITFELSDEAMDLFGEMIGPADKRGTVKLHQPLLNLVEGEFEVAGAHCKAYQFVSPPALLQYARSRNMLQLLPTRLVAIPHSFKESSIAARGIISQRILESYSSGKKNCVIMFTDIDKNYATDYKQKKKRFRELVSSILEYWRGEGFLQSYTFESSSPTKEITYISIDLNESYMATDFVNDPT